MLVITRRIGEKLMIGDETDIVVLGVNGNQVKLGIKADPSILILREELYRKGITPTDAVGEERSLPTIIKQKIRVALRG